MELGLLLNGIANPVAAALQIPRRLLIPADISSVRQCLRCRHCLPVQALLSRGVQHSSALVRYATLALLRQMLIVLGSVLADIHAAASAASRQSSPNGEAWRAFQRRIVAAVRGHLPDPQALLAVHNTLEAQLQATHQPATAVSSGAEPPNSIPREGRAHPDADMDRTEAHEAAEAVASFEALEGDGGTLSAAQLSMCHLLWLLGAYQRHLPQAMADTHFDPSRLMPQVRHMLLVM